MGTGRGSLYPVKGKLCQLVPHFPVSAWLGLCDREPEREPEVMELVARHIQQFFMLYQPKER